MSSTDATQHPSFAEPLSSVTPRSPSSLMADCSSRGLMISSGVSRSRAPYLQRALRRRDGSGWKELRMSASSSLADEPTLSWRAIVLYGLNTATYKIALGRTLEHLARTGRDRVTMPELAEVFFDLYADRLREGSQPQLSHPNHLTVAAANGDPMPTAESIMRSILDRTP